MFLQPLPGCQNQLLLLAIGYRLTGHAKRSTAPGLDLHEHQISVICTDEVNFTPPGTIIPFKDIETLVLQIFCGTQFSPFPYGQW